MFCRILTDKGIDQAVSDTLSGCGVWFLCEAEIHRMSGNAKIHNFSAVAFIHFFSFTHGISLIKYSLLFFARMNCSTTHSLPVIRISGRAAFTSSK